VEEKPTPIPRMAEPAEEKVEEEKKKRGWLWLLLVLIPLIAVSVFVVMKGYNNGNADTKNNTSAEENQTIEMPEMLADSVKTDTAAVQVQDSVLPVKTDTAEVVMKPAVPEVSEGPKYYLVGGSFSVEENADEYIVELKAKGFDAFRVGKKGRFYIVGIGSYGSFSEAEEAKQEYMNNNPGSEVWVWKK
jgi:cell division protein FtsN